MQNFTQNANNEMIEVCAFTCNASLSSGRNNVAQVCETSLVRGDISNAQIFTQGRHVNESLENVRIKENNSRIAEIKKEIFVSVGIKDALLLTCTNKIKDSCVAHHENKHALISMSVIFKLMNSCIISSGQTGRTKSIIACRSENAKTLTVELWIKIYLKQKLVAKMLKKTVN